MLHQLKVVIWKNLIIRKRHWFLTLIEAILPVCLFFLIAYGRSKITGLNKIDVTEPTYNEIEGIGYDINVGNTHLLYTPTNDYFNSIISKMHAKLQIPSDQVISFGTQEELLEYYYKNANYTTIGIVFENKDPKKLNYKIRYHDTGFHEFLQTGKKYDKSYSFQPRTGGAYKFKDFIPIQMALDMSFIEQNLHENNLNVSIYTQEFPYPPHKIDSAITTLFLELLPLITLFSFIFICPAVLKRVVEEKHTGTKELMKMVGMKSWMLWLGWFIYGIIPIFAAVICIVILMKVNFFGTDYPLIEYSNGGILFCFLLLYCSAAISFCFAISTFFNKPTVALVTGILIWILSFFVPKYALGLDESNQLSWVVNNLLNILPNMALHYGYSVISVFEEREVGVQWNNFYKSSSGSSDDITMLNLYMMLIFDTIFYILFTFYMDGINPGKYGVRKSFLFPIFELKKILGRSNSAKTKIESESVRLENIEEGHGLDKGIEINRLCKRYGPKVAVHDLNLDIYKNQITVLLGHNGAGKSTTMSMITGMIEATSGAIKINGMGVKGNMDEIRQNLGLCPQHNLLFTDLTVKEHLLFFAKLKGQTAQEADDEADELLKKLNMTEKKDAMAHTLSGGMQRKLCLGMALIGGSKVLILDEPSSGMDPESRRHLWDLLLKWRGEKTILITTHFMEEADALGDWIAIMADGSLKCYGTPLYLKKQYDTGYHLSLMINCDSHYRENVISRIKSEVLKQVAGAQLKSTNENNIVFVLPFDRNIEMPKLLEHLEERKSDLNIENISVTITTLEDVFLKTRLDSTNESSNSTVETQALLDLNMAGKNEDPLLKMKMKTLFIKKYQFFVKKWKAYTVPILIALVFFLLTGFLSTSGDGTTNSEPELKLTLSSYRQTLVFYNGTHNNNGLAKMMSFYKRNVEAEKSLAVEAKNVEDAILKKSVENIAYYNEHMIAGANFQSDTTLIALFNAMATHSLPISINLLTDSLAKSLLGPDFSISLSNWPLPSIKDDISRQELSETKVAILWLIMLPVGCLFILGSFIIFPHTEVSTKFLRLQYMCGVKPVWYWLVSFVADLIFYVPIMTVMAFILWCISPVLRNNGTEFGYLILIFLLYGLAGIPFTYLFSRKKTVSGAFALFIIMGMFLGIILTVTIGVLLHSQDDYYINIGTYLKFFCFLFIPQVGLSDALVNFAQRAVTVYNYKVMPKKLAARCSSEAHACCIENSAQCHDFKNYKNVFDDHLLMLGSCVMYMLIIIILDTYWMSKVFSKIRHRYNVILQFFKRPKDDQKQNDRQYQYTELPFDKKDKYNSLRANQMSKLYSGKQILKNINLTLKDGQCLGILGVNGAGKSTTFRMLTREEVLDDGTVKMELEGKTIDIGNGEYMETLGYCPQMDSLNFVLTGRQILTTIANLRGVNNPEMINTFLEIFDLAQYADTPCGYYSGGNKRKLSLAVSLIGFRKFVLLDEPTNGVDPSSRRKCWELIKNMQQTKNLSFILTSHSMTECEALCNDLKIMKDGRFVVEGNLAELKNNHGGFSLKIKLCNKDNKNLMSSDVDEVDGNFGSVYKFNNVEDLKKHFTKNERGEIKDEHSGLLHFYIKEKDKTWSKIFNEVELIKACNPQLIEDYAISEASLEDIFLEVARKDPDNSI